MPSPVGHAAAGLIVALAGARRIPSWGNASGKAGSIFLVCMFLAALPDIDYIYLPSHRGPTHSIGAAAIVTLLAACVTWWTTGGIRWRVAVLCGLAYGSHIVMDWLGEDPTLTPGVMAFWPFSERLFMSGWDLFRSTARSAPLAPGSLEHNAKTLAQEMAILVPILAALWWRLTRR